MYEDFYSKKLYPLQDKALKTIAGANKSFYLTGGTVLSRLYFHHRYSDDLDFFVNHYSSFRTETDGIIKKIKNDFKKTEIVLSDANFVRLIVTEKAIALKVEFINDVQYRAGKVGRTKLFPRTDNWKNILTNKISALSRDEEKDIADILYLCMKFRFNWQEVIAQAKEKDLWVNELDVSKHIFDFDISRCKKIKWITPPDFKKLEKLKLSVARDIVEGTMNRPPGNL